MRSLSLVLLIVLAGCDAFSEPGVELAADLDGTWDLAVTAERIGSDGSVASVEPREAGTDFYALPPPFVTIAPVVVCTNRGQTLDSVSDDARAAAFSEPDGSRLTCRLVRSDGDATRVAFVGDGPVATDVVATVREASASRHVWDFYRPQSDGTTIRLRWTLTPAG